MMAGFTTGIPDQKNIGEKLLVKKSTNLNWSSERQCCHKWKRIHVGVTESSNSSWRNCLPSKYWQLEDLVLLKYLERLTRATLLLGSEKAGQYPITTSKCKDAYLVGDQVLSHQGKKLRDLLRKCFTGSQKTYGSQKMFRQMTWSRVSQRSLRQGRHIVR